MQEQVEKTRRFMQKHNLPLNRSLQDYWKRKNVSTLIADVAETLIARAKKIEDLIPNIVYDPRLMRVALMMEELGETLLGLAHCDEVETLDGLSDLAFVTIGTSLAFDLPLVAGLDEVCKSNLTKKITKERCRDKGDGYVPPDIETIMASYRGDRIE